MLPDNPSGIERNEGNEVGARQASLPDGVPDQVALYHRPSFHNLEPDFRSITIRIILQNVKQKLSELLSVKEARQKSLNDLRRMRSIAIPTISQKGSPPSSEYVLLVTEAIVEEELSRDSNSALLTHFDPNSPYGQRGVYNQIEHQLLQTISSRVQDELNIFDRTEDFVKRLRDFQGSGFKKLREEFQSFHDQVIDYEKRWE